jgi:glyoxylase-like metal-dependent hydrolase (beta-lactamase superfamily II)
MRQCGNEKPSWIALMFPDTGITRRRILVASAALAAPALVRGIATPALAATPLLGATIATHYRFELGKFEVTTVLDAAAMIDGPWPIVGEDQPKADVEQLMRANLLPPTKFQPGFTPTFVNTGKELILFDAGNGADGFVPRPQGGWLASHLASAGFSPEQVDIVVLTHAHIDHIGGLQESGKELFPNARYVIGDVEYNFWSSSDRLSRAPDSLEYKSARLFRSNLMPFAERTSFLKADGEVVSGIRAVQAYGHTPGHLAFHLESEGKRLLLWGDCAHHEVASLARSNWHALFDMDKQMGAATRARIYDMAARDRIPVVGYHTSFPSVGFVERKDTGYRWLPVSYQLSL